MYMVVTDMFPRPKRRRSNGDFDSYDQGKHARNINGHIRPEYRSWVNIITRCTNKNRESWAEYGGRGITVCERWRYSFDAFIDDMGERPSGYSIDRINPNLGYEPSNCRWIPIADQSKTTRKYLGNLICSDCGDRRADRINRCHRCNEYFRRHGKPRPRDFQYPRLIDCTTCNRKNVRSVKGTCVWCYRAKWSRDNRTKKT